MSTAIKKARIGLLRIAEGYDRKITARDVAAAHLAIAVLKNLQEISERDQQRAGEMLMDQLRQHVQLQAARELLKEVTLVLELDA